MSALRSASIVYKGALRVRDSTELPGGSPKIAPGTAVDLEVYTPTEAYFSKSWSLPDIEKVK